ncbi:hypothetical protein ACO2Q8_28565 [Larkinella sp. VNQ87]|uniref:hypothetical protein n=1 Tax=Larkinella sp. VNQ87 TaxID=3400921 RepID=UPI003C00337D
MKNRFTYAVLLASALFVNACQTKQQNAESTSPTDSTEILAERPGTDPDAPMSDWMKKLAGSDEGLFRGVNLGDAVAVVKEKEEAEPFEEDASHIGYTIEYPNLESVDIQYFLDKAKTVSRIEVDIYLNNRPSVDEHLKELTAYFNRRFGPSGAQTWKGPGDQPIVLKDVSKGKDFGLKLTFGRMINA